MSSRVFLDAFQTLLDELQSFLDVLQSVTGLVDSQVHGFFYKLLYTESHKTWYGTTANTERDPETLTYTWNVLLSRKQLLLLVQNRAWKSKLEPEGKTRFNNIDHNTILDKIQEEGVSQQSICVF